MEFESENAEDAILVDEVEKFWFEPEGIWVQELYRSKVASVAVGSVPVEGRQARHIQDRGDDGIELMYVHQGVFSIDRGDSKSRVFDTKVDGPILITIPSLWEATLVNEGTTEVRFLAIFAPELQLEEIKFL